jgi:hypothetical protein
LFHVGVGANSIISSAPHYFDSFAGSFSFISISRLSRNRECSCFILRFYVADSNILAIEMLCVIVVT